MPFNADTKSKMFIKSARICCLCYKQCGINIEAAHIKAEADGGSNDEENGIPLCFDCHQETGGYDNRHPKGNKFTSTELKARRNKIYELVEKGTIQAQIIAAKMHSGLSPTKIESKNEIIEKQYKPSHEVTDIIALAKQSNFQSFPLKLKLLNEKEEAYVIDHLLKNANNENMLNSLLAICRSKAFEDKQLIILEQILRKITISNDLDLKNQFMENADVKLLNQADEGLRIAFFSEIISILGQNQFKEVNKITRNVVNIQEAIPSSLHMDYIDSLFRIAESNAFHATPIAKKTLLNLPKEFIKNIFTKFDAKFLLWNRGEMFKEVIDKYSDNWPVENTELYADFISLSSHKFRLKYDEIEET